MYQVVQSSGRKKQCYDYNRFKLSAQYKEIWKYKVWKLRFIKNPRQQSFLRCVKTIENH